MPAGKGRSKPTKFTDVLLVYFINQIYKAAQLTNSGKEDDLDGDMQTKGDKAFLKSRTMKWESTRNNRALDWFGKLKYYAGRRQWQK